MATWHQAHADAVAAGKRRYVDPITGYSVFTELGLRARGHCCGCGCRHCPYPDEDVAAPPARILGPLGPSPAVVLFWSGGKDSFLALRRLWRSRGHRQLVLCTTYAAASGTVAHQEVHIRVIRAQATELGLPLLEVPLPGGEAYVEVVGDALATLGKRVSIEQLAFGDLHLAHIRQWRQDNLAPVATSLGAEMVYPLWEVDYGVLLTEWEASGAMARVCAVPDPAATGVQVGTPFSRALTASLPEGVDAFGERGEFHSEMLLDGLGAALRK